MCWLPDMASLEDTLAALATMSPAQLRDEWGRLYRSAPPRFSTELLRHAIGYRVQELEQPKQTAAAHRALRRLGSSKVPPSPTLRAGTRLMRSWNGRSIAVLVTDDGFIFEERTYRSLSAIAKAVTGTNWSGPRFFGLNGSTDRG